MPLSFKPLFWDVEFSSLDTKAHAQFIITRILEKGKFSHLRWLFSSYNYLQIQSIVSSTKLSHNTKSLWNRIFAHD